MNWIMHDIFRAAVWRSLHGVNPATAALIAVGVVVLVLGIVMARR